MPASPLSKCHKLAAVHIGKAQWATVFNKQFPTATKEQRLESWKQHRKEYAKIGQIAVRQLLRSGFQITGGTES